VQVERLNNKYRRRWVVVAWVMMSKMHIKNELSLSFLGRLSPQQLPIGAAIKVGEPGRRADGRNRSFILPCS
jgi:hypothetical protein